jgi:hypothetical protein
MNWIIYRSILMFLSLSSSDRNILVRKLNLSHTVLNLIDIILGFFMVRTFLLFDCFNISLKFLLIHFVLIYYLRLILMEEDFVHDG